MSGTDVWMKDTHGPVSGEIFGHNRSKSESVSKSNRLHVVVIFPVFLYWFELYSTDSSTTIGDFPEVLNFDRLFLNLNWFICN